MAVRQRTRNGAWRMPLLCRKGPFFPISRETISPKCTLCSWLAFCISEKKMYDSVSLGSNPWYLVV